jgi:phosphohistidine phosphatase
VTLYLVHHGHAVGPDVDLRRPLSPLGREHVGLLAAEAAARGVKPAVVWHSGKLRARQTADAFWRACNPFAEFAATRDVQPGDPPQWFADRLRGETRDILLAGHFPHLPSLLTLLIAAPGEDVEAGEHRSAQTFPPHGIVALESHDEGGSWVERWRLNDPNP